LLTGYLLIAKARKLESSTVNEESGRMTGRATLNASNPQMLEKLPDTLKNAVFAITAFGLAALKLV